MRRATKTALLCSLCLGAGTAAFGQAQHDFARDRDLGVLDRPRPEYDALGVPVSAFLLYPRLNVVTGYNDNIFATDTAVKGAGFVQLQPSAALRSQWSQHELDLNAHASINRWFSQSSEDTDDYGAALNGRLDVLASTKITGGASYDLETEPREAETSARNTVNPVQFSLWTAQLAGSHQFNRLQVSLSGTFDSYNYIDGRDALNNIVDEHYRSVQDYGETLRADYALSPDCPIRVRQSQSAQLFDPAASCSIQLQLPRLRDFGRRQFPDHQPGNRRGGGRLLPAGLLPHRESEPGRPCGTRHRPVVPHRIDHSNLEGQPAGPGLRNPDVRGLCGYR